MNCDEGWTFDGVDKCIKVLPELSSHSDAKEACIATGGTLGVPKSSAWEDIVVSKIDRIALMS